MEVQIEELRWNMLADGLGCFPGVLEVFLVHPELTALVLQTAERDHWRPASTTFVEVISLPLWPLTWKFLVCTGG